MSTAEHVSDRGGPAPVLQRSYDRPPGLDNPRAPRRKGGMPNFEKYAWLFMRFSGIVLVFLALGHLFVMLMWDEGVYRIDFNYVAQRWASPFWQTWDLLLLWLAQLHGGNGIRTIIADYTRKDSTKFWLNTLLALSMAFTLVLGTYVHNFSERARKRQLILHTTVTIGYDAPWRTVHDLLVAAARATPTIVDDPAPFVLQTSLDDFYVSYQLNAYTDSASGMVNTYSALHQNIQDAFNAAGVEIMSPHYRQLRDGNTVTIPADQRPPGYRAPAFEVSVRPPEPPAA